MRAYSLDPPVARDTAIGPRRRGRDLASETSRGGARRSHAAASDTGTVTHPAHSRPICEGSERLMSALERQWDGYRCRLAAEFNGTDDFLEAVHREPVHRFGEAILVTRYADVAAIHRDATRYGSRAGLGSQAEEIRASLSPTDRQNFEELQSFRRLLMAREDGEQHRKLRAIAHRAFTPRRIATLRLEIERYMESLVASVEAPGVLNLSEIAYRLPLRVIGDLLSVPRDHHKQLHDWSQQFAQGATGTGANPGAVSTSLEAIQQFKQYSQGLLERWRDAPGGSDLVGALVAGGDTSAITPLELAGMFVQLIVAGQETTARLISCGMYELLRRPDQWALLCADPDGRAANTTEELLRVVSPLPFQARVPSRDVDIAGFRVKAGTTVYPILAAANRDPEVFTNPRAVDILRENARQHLAFGVGPHFCLGASLARSEGIIAFGMLARRFPEMKLTESCAGWTSRLGVPDRQDLKVLV
jgi:cytochrome P450